MKKFGWLRAVISPKRTLDLTPAFLELHDRLLTGLLSYCYGLYNLGEEP